MVTMVTVMGSITMVDKVHITEVPVAVRFTIAVGAIRRVACSGGAGLLVAVTIGADHKRRLITVVESVISTFAGVFTMIGV